MERTISFDDAAPEGSRLLVIAARPRAAAIAAELEASGLRSTLQSRADAVMKSMYVVQPALVIIASELERGTAMEALRAVRMLSNTPVMMLGAGADEAASIAALRAGADDYVFPPFSGDSLRARVQALLRRSGGVEPTITRYADGMIEVDLKSFDVRVRGVEVALSPIEYRLLLAFLKNPNRVLSGAELLARVWNDTAVPNARVKLYVGYLRKKLAAAGAARTIETVRGFGYRYVPANEAYAPTAADAQIDIFAPLFEPLEELRGSRGQVFFPDDRARTELARALVRRAADAAGDPDTDQPSVTHAA